MAHSRDQCRQADPREMPQCYDVQSARPSGCSLYPRLRSSALILECATVIRPVQQCLPLTRAAKWISWLTIHFDLIDMATKCLPALDLARVLIHDSAAEVISAIPLEPSTRVVRINPTFRAPFREGLAGV